MENIEQEHVLYYQSIVGKYISSSCKLEHFCHVFLIEHYVNYDDKLTGQFVKDILSKQEISFSTILNMFVRIINEDDQYTDIRDLDIINKPTSKSIIKYRNIFAHAAFNGVVNKKYEFLWLNSHYEKNIYSFDLTSNEMEASHEKLIKFINKVLVIVSPIIEREIKKHGEQ